MSALGLGYGARNWQIGKIVAVAQASTRSRGRKRLAATGFAGISLITHLDEARNHRESQGTAENITGGCSNE